MLAKGSRPLVAAAMALLVAIGCSSASSVPSSVLPPDYKYLRVGMPFEEAVASIVRDERHAVRMAWVGDESPTHLPKEPAAALQMVSDREAAARKAVGQGKGGAELAADLASIGEHAWTEVQAEPAEGSPYRRVNARFSKGNVLSIEITYAGSGKVLRSEVSEQLRKKYGEPVRSQSLGDEMESHVWYLCSLRLAYEFLYLGPGPGAGPLGTVSVKVRSMRDKEDGCPTAPPR